MTHKKIKLSRVSQNQTCPKEINNLPLSKHHRKFIKENNSNLKYENIDEALFDWPKYNLHWSNQKILCDRRNIKFQKINDESAKFDGQNWFTK